MKYCCFILSIIICLYSSAAQADDYLAKKVTPDTTPEHKTSNVSFELDIAPYYENKRNEKDYYSVGFSFEATFHEVLEFDIASDFLSYQSPNLGISDLVIRLSWTFLDKKDFSISIDGLMDFPTGSEAFQETEPIPTLGFTFDKKFGNFDASLFLGSSFNPDYDENDKEAYYFDFGLAFELDYTPDKKNSFGLIYSGYTPDQFVDGRPRSIMGLSYTRNLDEKNSLCLSLNKGLSQRGTDLLIAVIYKLSF